MNYGRSAIPAWTLPVLGILAALPLSLRAADAADAQPETYQGYTLIEEVLVEARRRSESLQDVPLSITALTDGSLRNLGVDEIKDLSSFAPGLDIEGGVDNNTTRFFEIGRAHV